MSDNAIAALRGHLDRWDDMTTPAFDSNEETAEMLSEVMDDVRVLIAVEDAVIPQHPMVVAYHTLFDFKDSLDPTSQEYYRCYETLAFMARSMQDMGMNEHIPNRYDAPREV